VTAKEVDIVAEVVAVYHATSVSIEELLEGAYDVIGMGFVVTPHAPTSSRLLPLFGALLFLLLGLCLPNLSSGPFDVLLGFFELPFLTCLFRLVFFVDFHAIGRLVDGGRRSRGGLGLRSLITGSRVFRLLSRVSRRPPEVESASDVRHSGLALSIIAVVVDKLFFLGPSVCRIRRSHGCKFVYDEQG
jgi:hypothetical protein